jgi:uncharacterized protein YdiU (UPF0061 family)
VILDHSYANELPTLGSLVKPEAINNARLSVFNNALAVELGLPSTWSDSEYLIEKLFGKDTELNMFSMAQKYGGHQFGSWNPELGDGRGLLLTELVDKNNQRWDLHLKGAGPTPYSRFADGRAVLRSTIREYLASEALHHLGIPTSRALCLLTSDEPVYREKQETTAMLIRVCQSHIRFGHFEYFFHSKQLDKLDQLFSYCFKYHFADCAQEKEPHLCMLQKIVKDTAIMVAKWQAYGFNHGVMNTDNMSIHGITFDFGPYAFLDDFDPGFICNHSDHSGRYAFDKQPGVALWNLNALAHAFTPYLSIEQLKLALAEYEPSLLETYGNMMRQKCGLKKGEPDNQQVVNEWLDLLAQDKRDYTISFRMLCEFDMHGDNATLRDHFIDREKFSNWAENYKNVLVKQNMPQEKRQAKMKRQNPNYILRNYLAQLAIDEAEGGHFDKLEALLNVLQTPFSDTEKYAEYAKPPPKWGKHMEISCSS